ncbi:Cthe_2314 family HEPN domain-containing protein [Salinicoccus hispanicus]|uniref:Uncharacterized protein n=1 Tax=Salinicoccus hispanicus TaxID=157225 RepID=A0A6N8U2L3_9STAP|nr:Cthe_2314 family HEPN domain-containing protein [Salinicoccus hispanicus]MXQ50391.1 hypothetical protein [Salinicoccus hispanicus]
MNSVFVEMFKQKDEFMVSPMKYDENYCLGVHNALRDRYLNLYIGRYSLEWALGFRLLKFSGDVNPVIQSINITINNLFASYSLTDYQKYLLSKTPKENKDYYWYLYHLDRLASDISTLKDLQLILINRVNELQYDERYIRREFFKKCKLEPLRNIIFDHKFRTSEIRNDFTHSVKPFVFQNEIITQGGILALGQGDRKLDMDRDHWKIDYDFLLILDRMDKLIDHLRLSRLHFEDE